jgi:CheY-like chemotaxis protein
MRYQIIFTDFNMPVMNGIDSTKAIRSFFRENAIQQPKIIGVTGHVQDEFKNQGLSAGMDEILEKPLYAHSLRALVAKYNI